MAATTFLRSPLIVAQTASGVTSQAVDCSNFGSLAVVLQANGTTTSGTVIVEEADWKDGDAPYAGTWSLVGTYTAGTDVTSNSQSIIHTMGPELAFHFVRARIGTVIGGGGTVTVTLLGRPL